MYACDWIRLRQHMKLFNTSKLLASNMSELGDVNSTFAPLTCGNGTPLCARTYMSRIIWPNGPMYCTPCLLCGMAYCVCAGSQPSPPSPSAPMIAALSQASSAPMIAPPIVLIQFEHTRTPPLSPCTPPLTPRAVSEPYTPTLTPEYSYSSAWAQLGAMSDCSNDNHDGNDDGSGDDNGAGTRGCNVENDMENNAVGTGENNADGNDEDNGYV